MFLLGVFSCGPTDEIIEADACSDGILNQDETYTDNGGVCAHYFRADINGTYMDWTAGSGAHEANGVGQNAGCDLGLSTHLSMEQGDDVPRISIEFENLYRNTNGCDAGEADILEEFESYFRVGSRQIITNSSDLEGVWLWYKDANEKVWYSRDIEGSYFNVVDSKALGVGAAYKKRQRVTGVVSCELHDYQGNSMMLENGEFMVGFHY